MKKIIKPLFLLSSVALLAACNSNAKVLWTDADYGVLQVTAKRMEDLDPYERYKNIKFSGTCTDEVTENDNGYFDRYQKTAIEYSFDSVDKKFYAKVTETEEKTYAEGKGTSYSGYGVFETYMYLDNEEGLIKISKYYNNEEVDYASRDVIYTPYNALEAYTYEDVASFDEFFTLGLCEYGLFNEIYSFCYDGFNDVLSRTTSNASDWWSPNKDDWSFKGSKISNDPTKMKLRYTENGAYINEDSNIAFTDVISIDFDKNISTETNEDYEENGSYIDGDKVEHEYHYVYKVRNSNKFKSDITIPEYETWKEIYE